MPDWQALGCSVRGASHVRDGLPNQDAMLLDGEASGVVAAVADGHGGARHFRSADGARLAVAAAHEALLALAETFQRSDAAERARVAAVELPLRIVTRWIELTQQHLAGQPISDAEWAALIASEGDDALAAVRADPLLAYGATLIAALVLPGCRVLTQLGDGDLIAVDGEGHTTRPVPRDERLGGNITTSICRPGAEADFRSIVLDAGDPATPALLLLATDGYANSFRSDADFLQVGSDFLALLRQHGAGAVEQQLEGILGHASTHGSGDDITLAMLVAPQAAPAPQRVAAQPAAVSPVTRSALQAIEQRMGRQRQWIVGLAAALLAVVLWTQRDRLPLQRPAVPEPEAATVVLPTKPLAVDSGLAGDDAASAAAHATASAPSAAAATTVKASGPRPKSAPAKGS